MLDTLKARNCIKIHSQKFSHYHNVKQFSTVKNCIVINLKLDL